MVRKNNRVAFVGLILLLGIVLTISFVLAAHVITTSTGGTSYSVNEDVGFIYNITVNNTDTTSPANISQVNITIPNTFSFLVNSNGTNAETYTFTNTSTVLSWNNTNGLVMNLTWKYFWFNATASTPGNYNLTITTTNATGSFSSNISVTINDTTSPSSIQFVSPTESDNTNLSRLNIVVNVTATDNGVINTIIARLFNSTRNQINSSNSSTSPLFINFTGLSDGVYYFNATINDTYGNSNSTSTRTITLDTTSPVITLISPADSTSSTTSAYNFTFNVTDTNTISNCSLIFDGSIINTLTSANKTGGTNGMYNSSLGITTHSWSINCTDIAGNTGNSSARTLIVTAAATSSTSYSSVILSFWVSTQLLSNDQFSQGYSKELMAKHRLTFKINNTEHGVGVISLTATTATINVSSKPQQVVFSIGNEKKFEVTNDTYYDVLVKLNGIANNKANVTIKSIHDLMTAEEQEQQQENGDNAAAGEETSQTSYNILKDVWFWVIAAVIVIFLIVFFLVYRKKR